MFNKKLEERIENLEKKVYDLTSELQANTYIYLDEHLAYLWVCNRRVSLINVVSKLLGHLGLQVKYVSPSHEDCKIEKKVEDKK